MKPNNNLRVLAALSGAVLFLPLGAFAQTTPAGSPRTITSATTTTNDVGEREEHHNYGWIGLLGLIGLAGLMPKKHVEHYGPTAGRTDVRR